MPKLLLIDLNHLYWTAFHGMGSESNMAAEFVERRVLEMRTGYDAVVACYDQGSSWRKKEYPAYKEGRPEKDPASWDQLRRLRERLENDGIPTLAVEGYEADDAIATLAIKAPGHGYTSVIASGDKDLLQLLAASGVEYLSTNNPGGWMTAEKVKEKFGVGPECLGDWLALVGDKSDNVQGCPGVGATHATRLLTELGSLANMFEAPAGITPDRLRESFIANREQIRLARKLVSLSTDVPIDFEQAIKPPERKEAPKGDAFEGDFEESPKDEASNGEAKPAADPQDAGSPVASKPALSTKPAEPSSALVLDRQDPRWMLALEPRGPEQLKSYCRHLYESKLYTKFPNADSIMAVVLRGRALGLDMTTSLDVFNVIKGKPTMGAMAIVGLCISSGKAEYFEPIEVNSDKESTWETKRRGGRKEVRLTYKFEDAEKAGLTKPSDRGEPSNWVKRPKEMLRKQAAVVLARLVYPDVVSNVYDPDELTD